MNYPGNAIRLNFRVQQIYFTLILSLKINTCTHFNTWSRTWVWWYKSMQWRTVDKGTITHKWLGIMFFSWKKTSPAFQRSWPFLNQTIHSEVMDFVLEWNDSSRLKNSFLQASLLDLDKKLQGHIRSVPQIHEISDQTVRGGKRNMHLNQWP